MLECQPRYTPPEEYNSALFVTTLYESNSSCGDYLTPTSPGPAKGYARSSIATIVVRKIHIMRRYCQLQHGLYLAMSVKNQRNIPRHARISPNHIQASYHLFKTGIQDGRNILAKSHSSAYANFHLIRRNYYVENKIDRRACSHSDRRECAGAAATDQPRAEPRAR